MSQILLIRHAETDLRGTFCGHSDPPLNEKGQSQLQTLIDELKSCKIDAVYTSDLQRARLTAQAIGQQVGAPLHTNPDLREIHFGAWEGHTWQQIEQLDHAYAQRWVEEYPHLPAPDGESYKAFHTRVLRAYASIAASRHTSNIAIVTHAGVMQLLLTTLCGRTAQQAYEQTREYCCVVSFQPVHVVQHV